MKFSDDVIAVLQ